ncbi:GNAT family N-acetyltransferase [Brachybacterium sp. AOP43-C2-M15]|uniref:GNAT family N-acetyltransferase n=1 Tax=Brachybacterium sp. AOP43-C2-M15 TaxID=3457661 RepID=UPI004033C585
MRVHLREVDEAVLDRLLRTAVQDAAAHEVTPPLTPGPAWTPERISWFLEHHRRARSGVDGPAGEATWAVTLEDRPVGAVRLRRLDADTLETGIWLGRSARGCGAGTRAMRAVLARARQERADVLTAETAAENRAMRTILHGLGFVPGIEAPPGRVSMSLPLAAGRR